MKVLLVSADYPPVRSGEATHAVYLARHLADSGLSVSVLTSRIPGLLASPGVSLHAVMRDWSWREVPRFISVLRQVTPQVVLIVFLGTMYRHHPMMTYAPTICRRFLPGVRVVTQFEAPGVFAWNAGTWALAGRKLAMHWSGSRDTNYEYGTLLRDSDAVIVLSEMHRRKLVEAFGGLEAKCSLIPPPPLMKVVPKSEARVAATRRRLGLNRQDFALLYYGYMYRGKGIETLLQALRQLRKRGLPVRLVISGGFRDPVCELDPAAGPRKYSEEISDLVHHLGVNKDIIWAGETSADGEDASQHLHASDACVMPFRLGVHLNNSTFAAAAVHGLPIVATKGETTETAFRDGHNVRLCAPDSPEDLCRAIVSVVEDSTLRERLRVGALEMANEWFSWETATKRVVRVLEGSSTGTHTSSGRHVRESC